MDVICSGLTVLQYIIEKQVLKGAGKSLAQPGRKQATVTEDFEFHICYL